MNSIQFQFVNREDELERIIKHATAWGTSRILVIDGVGGIGKTRLLEEVYRRRQEYIDVLKGQLRVSRVVNLDDIALQVPMNMGRRIANEIASAKFQEYLDHTDRIMLLESKGLLTLDAFEQHLHGGDDSFLRAYDALAKEERILLLLDTAESILSLPVGRYLLKLIPQLKNICVLLAGREGIKARELLSQVLEDIGNNDTALDYLKLEAFTPSVAKGYLEQTPVGSYLEAQPHLRDNLLLLTEGRPLLLALAGEWLRRDVPLPELTERTADELRALPEGERSRLQKQFERALVSQIRNLRADMADLILDMAHFKFRFDADLLSAITGKPEEESRQKIKTLEDLFFAKSMPDGSVVLHDEMQRLVEEYVWSEIDPFGTRRKQLSQKAVEHYQQRLNRLDMTLQKLEKAIQAAEEHHDLAEAAEARREYLEHTRLRWTLAHELLHYALHADLIKGYDLFKREYDTASDQYQYMLRPGLIQEMETYESKLPDVSRYEVSIRIAKYQLDIGNYEKSKTRLLQLLKAPLVPSQRVEVLLQWGNVEIRLGDFDRGISRFKEAVEICETSDLEKELVQIENALGWGFRLMGDWDEAAIHYRKALKLALKLKAWRQEGWLLNNLAFVYAYLRKRDEALQLSDQALRVWKVDGFQRGLGAAYSTRGSIMYKFGQFDEALKYFAEALAIFESQNDIEWLSTVHCWRGVNLWAMGRLDDAREDLEKAREIGLKKDIAIILNRLARVYRDQGQNDKARELLHQSYQSALELGDKAYELVGLSDLAHLDMVDGRFSALDTYQQKLAVYLQAWKRPDSMALGRLNCYMGSLAVGQDRLEGAIDHYQRGLTLIAQCGSYGRISLLTELNNLETALEKLAKPAFLRRLGGALSQVWETKELEASNPEALPIFARWVQWPE